jgi:hypothetical protein
MLGPELRTQKAASGVGSASVRHTFSIRVGPAKCRAL